MKFSVLKDNLLAPLQLSSRFVAQKAQLPVLGHIVLEATEDGLRLKGTDLEKGMILRIGAKVEEEGSVGVPAKLFVDLVQSLPSGVISFSLEEGMLLVVIGGVRAKIATHVVEEFPELSTSIEGKSYLGEYSLELLSQMMDKVGFCVSKDVTRPVLTGVLWDMAKKSVVATDGFRLARLAHAFEDSKGEGLLLPGHSLADVVKALEVVGADTVRVYLHQEDKELLWVMDDAWMVLRLLEGEYPAYEAIIPKKQHGSMTLEVDGFTRAVKAAALFAQDSAHVVRFVVAGGVLEVSANTPQVGENVVRVEPVNTEGEFEEIAFNSRYLLDFLQKVEGNEVVFAMSESLKPGVFREKGHGNVQYVVMPIRIKK